MKIHRSRPADRFTIIPHETLRDPRLSYRARGVLAEILSRPDDWQTTADALARIARRARGHDGEGRDAMRAVFAELETCGYLRRIRRRGPDGRTVTDLHVYDVPAGRTNDGTGSRWPDLGKHASPQVAPTTAYQASVDQASVDQASVDQASLRRPNTEIVKKNDQEESSLSRALVALRAAAPDITEREGRQILANLKSNTRVKAPVPYLTAAIANGDAAALVAEARDQLAEQDDMARVLHATPTPRPGRLDWCGQCDQRTRHLDLPDGRVTRCPACHPEAPRIINAAGLDGITAHGDGTATIDGRTVPINHHAERLIAAHAGLQAAP